MATLSKNIHKNIESKVPKKHGMRYPWNKWFRYKKFTLIKGVHFNTRVDTMAQQIRNAAKPTRYNLHISISISDEADRITVTILKRR